MVQPNTRYRVARPEFYERALNPYVTPNAITTNETRNDDHIVITEHREDQRDGQTTVAVATLDELIRKDALHPE